MKNRFALFLVLSIFWITGFVKAQNQVIVNVVVQPPYSPDISYYFDNPGRLIVTLVNTTSQDLDIYLRGSFMDEEGIGVRTGPNFKPASSLTINAMATYNLTLDDFSKIFSTDDLQFVGVDMNEIIRNKGLPEGMYRICFQVFDYHTDQPLSTEGTGCSNYFPIRYIDPPVILSPVCGDTIISTGIQNVIVTWSVPVGASPNVKYRFVMTEMHPNDRDPNDALNAAVPPYFIEKEVSVPQVIITSADPPLVPGRSYAFRVQAFDPDNQIIFNNNGISEACWFHYKESFINNDVLPNGSGLSNDMVDFLENFDFVPHTVVTGRLFAKLPEDGQVISPTGAVSLYGDQSGSSTVGEGSQTGQNNQGGNNTNPPNNFEGIDTGFVDLTGGLYQNFVNNSLLNGGDLNINNATFPSGNYIQGAIFLPPVGRGLINPQTVNVNGAVPLKNVQIRLVLRPVLKKNNGFYDAGEPDFVFEPTGGADPVNYVYKDINGNIQPFSVFHAIQNKVMAVTWTDDQGNFSFDFQSDFFTGPIIKRGNVYGGLALKIEVVRAEFCSPDVDIYIEPGDNIDIGDEVALFNTYDAKIKVLTNPNIKGAAIEENAPIPGAIVGIYRKQSELGEVPDIVVNHEGFRKSKLVRNIHGKFLEIFTGQVHNDGTVIIPNLMYHRRAKPDGYYHINARTRAWEPGHEEENTLYNYSEIWRPVNLLERSLFPGNEYIDYTVPISQTMIPNHQYEKKTFTTTCVLDPEPPEIKGRVMAQTNLENVALKNAKAQLVYTDNCLEANFCLEELTDVNKSGYFRFTGLNVYKDENGAVKGPQRRVFITAVGYKPVLVPSWDMSALNAKDGELIDLHDIQMEPAQMLYGEVTDEEGNPVPAYVRILPGGPYYKTETPESQNLNIGYNNGYFGSYLQIGVGIPNNSSGQSGQSSGLSGLMGNLIGFNSGNMSNLASVASAIELPGHEYFKIASPKTNIHIEITPLSNQYFPLDTVITALPEDENERILFKVPKKLHRLHLLVENSSTNAGIPNAIVVVGDTMAYGMTGDDAVVKLAFPSPGEQFLVKVSADGFTPTQQSFTIPVSQDWTNKVIFLEPAYTVEGYVKEANSGQPVDSAMIYVQLQSSDGHTVYIEAYTDVNGKYSLAGVPSTLQNIEIHATKSGNNPSYIGNSKTFKIEPFAFPPKSYDLTITRADGWDLSDIWGFPVTIEKIEHDQGTRYIVSGYFHDLPALPDFSMINKDEKVYFKSLQAHKSASHKIEPQQKWINTECHSIPVKIQGGFEGNFRERYQGMMTVKKKGDYAQITAPLQLDLASFKFAYDFDGELYMDDDTITNGGVDLPLFKSGKEGNQNYPDKYYIVEEDNFPIEDFRVFGFEASSDYKGSYYQNGKINLQTYLHTNIPAPGAGSPLDLNINAGKIVITKEDLNLVPNENSLLTFNLEKWKVRSTQGWTFDKTKDAIIVPKATIFTGAGVDADIKGLNIRPDALREGEIDMSGSGLSLGAVVPLELNPSVKPMFNYDAGVGHYRISMVGNSHGLPAATVSNLPAINKKLEFKSIGMLSDGTNVLNIMQKVRFYNILDMDISQIMTGPGFFQLAGMPKLGIPGFVPTRAIMTYKKQNGNLVAEIEPLSGAIDCNRNVEFVLEQHKIAQHIEQNHYTCYGDIFVKPSLNEGGEKFSFRALLEKTPNDAHIEVIKVDGEGQYKGSNPQKFYTGEHYMNVFEGDIAVENNQWQNLWYKANTNSQGLSNDNVGKFTVNGGIEFNSDNIKADSIDVPGLGTLKLVYLFDETALVGNLTIEEDLDMGFGTVSEGEMESRFDPHGFYLGLGAELEISGETYTGGFILGAYNSSVEHVARKFLSDFASTPPDFSTIHGFYLIGKRTLVDEHFTIPVVPPIEVVAKAFAEVNVYLDYENPEFTLGGYIYAYGKGGVTVLGCYIGASGEVYIEVHGGYIKLEGVYFDADGNLQIRAGACGLEGCVNAHTHVHLSTGGSCSASFSIGLCD